MISLPKILKIDFWLFKVEYPEHRMHKWTITIGLILCMCAGAMTVTQGISPNKKSKAYRIYRTARRTGRKTKQYLSEIWN